MYAKCQPCSHSHVAHDTCVCCIRETRNSLYRLKREYDVESDSVSNRNCDFRQRHFFLCWKSGASILNSEHGITNWFWCAAVWYLHKFGIGQFTQIVTLATHIPVKSSYLLLLVFKIVETFYFILCVCVCEMWKFDFMSLFKIATHVKPSSFSFPSNIKLYAPFGTRGISEHLNTKHVFRLLLISFLFYIVYDVWCMEVLCAVTQL